MKKTNLAVTLNNTALISDTIPSLRGMHWQTDSRSILLPSTHTQKLIHIYIK